MLDDVQTTIKDQELLSQKRAILSHAAAKRFFKKGYERTSIQDVADAAGISIGSVYRYIGKKEDLLTLLLHYVVKIVNDELLPISELRLEPEEKLRRLFERYCKLVDTYNKYFVVTIRENRSMDSQQREVISELEGRIIACFLSAIQEGICNEVFDDSVDEFFAYNMLILGQQWTMRHYHYKGITLDEFIEKQWIIINKCLKPL